MKGSVMSVCIHRKEQSGWDRGVVFAGVDRKKLIDVAMDWLTGQHRDAIPQIRKELCDFVEGKVDEGRVDVQLEGVRFHTYVGVSVFYNACEVVQ